MVIRPIFSAIILLNLDIVTIVGKAKVISYEDIEEGRVKRAAKEAEAATKKCGRKRACPTPTGAKAKKARRSEVEVAEDEIAAGGPGDYCSVLQRWLVHFLKLSSGEMRADAVKQLSALLKILGTEARKLLAASAALTSSNDK